MYCNNGCETKKADYLAGTIKIGSTQGAVLSPVLFDVYIDGLFHNMLKNKYGCQLQISLWALLHTSVPTTL